MVYPHNCCHQQRQKDGLELKDEGRDPWQVCAVGFSIDCPQNICRELLQLFLPCFIYETRVLPSFPEFLVLSSSHVVPTVLEWVDRQPRHILDWLSDQLVCLDCWVLVQLVVEGHDLMEVLQTLKFSFCSDTLDLTKHVEDTLYLFNNSEQCTS